MIDRGSIGKKNQIKIFKISFGVFFLNAIVNLELFSSGYFKINKLSCLFIFNLKGLLKLHQFLHISNKLF